jgi:hypothetical protein
MGVTIHIDGKLLGASEYDALLHQVREFASSHRWPMEEIHEARRFLERVRNEQDWDYIGLTKGIVVYPHDDAEPLRLLAYEVALLFTINPDQMDRTFPLDEANHLRHRIFRRNRNQHMHVIREKMTRLDPALFLLRQPAEHLS